MPVLKELDGQNISLGKETFTNAILVPFPNRLYNGNYEINNHKYHIEAHPNTQPHAVHGFMYNRPIENQVEEFTDSRSKVVLKTKYTKDVTGYPFEFELSITYEISDKSGFVCTVAVKNTGVETMPIGTGLHPYFKFDTLIDNVSIELPPCQLLETDPEFIPNGILSTFPEFQKPELIGDYKFNHCFLANPGQDKIEIKLATDEYRLIYTQDYTTSKYFQLFIPPDRQSIAVEPMTCAIDAFNNKQGLINLKPGESCNCTYGVRIE